MSMKYQENYLHWLKNTQGAETAELAGLSAADITERFSRPLQFGTAGLRGIMRLGTNGMNPYTVARASYAFALVLRKQPGQGAGGVVLSADTRQNSLAFAEVAAEVFAACGVPVYNLGQAPVPVCSFAVRRYGAAAGVMLTASHNPPQYNGYKAYGPDGVQLSPEHALQVEQTAAKLDYFDTPRLPYAVGVSQGLIRPVSAFDAYFAAVAPLCRNPKLVEASGLRVVYTPLHGTGYPHVPRGLALVGCRQVSVVQSQQEPDGRFPTVRLPNPEDPAALRLAIEQAKEQGADLAIATDPDCDRMGAAVADGRGGYATLTGNQLGCLMLAYLAAHNKTQKKGVVITTIVSSELAGLIAAKRGWLCEEVLTGFKFIGERAKACEESADNEFVFGYEESYGFLQGTQARDKDGIAASMLLCETAAAAKAEGKTLLDKLEELYGQFGYVLEESVSLERQGEKGLQEIKAAMERLRQSPPCEIAGRKVLAVRDYKTRLRTAPEGESALDLPVSDVLYLEGEGFWACARPSGTEPKLKFYLGVREPSREKAEELLNSLCAAFRKLVE